MKKTSKRTGGSQPRSRVRQRPSRARPVAAPGRAAQRAAAPGVADALAAFADVAKRLRLRWYVFGAQAVNLHGFPRATADLDITLDLAQRSPRELIGEIRKAGFVARFVDDAFIASTRVIPIVHRASGLPIDLVIAGPGLEQRFLDEIQLRRVGRRRIPVLSPENLIVTELLAARPKDLQDVRELVASRGDHLDHDRILELLALLERALDQSDLVPLYHRLCDDATRD